MPVPGTPIRWDQDADGVVVLTLDDPTQAANTLNTGFRAALAATVDRLEAENDRTQYAAIVRAARSELRKLMGTANGTEPLSGHVEMDETYLGGKEMNKHAKKKLKAGRGVVGKLPVFGMLERDGDVRAQVVPNAQRATLEPIIIENVETGAVISTDEAAMYKTLPAHGYGHGVVEHSAGQYVSGIHHTNGIEGFWSHFKRGVVSTHVHIGEFLLNLWHVAADAFIAGAPCRVMSVRLDRRSVRPVRRSRAVTLQAENICRLQQVGIVPGAVNVVATETTHAVRVHGALHKIVALHAVLVGGAIGKEVEVLRTELCFFEMPYVGEAIAGQVADGPVWILTPHKFLSCSRRLSLDRYWERDGTALGVALHADIVGADVVKALRVDDVLLRGVGDVLTAGAMTLLAANVPFGDLARGEVVVHGVAAVAGGTGGAVGVGLAVVGRPPVGAVRYVVGQPLAMLDVPLRGERIVIAATFFEVALLPAAAVDEGDLVESEGADRVRVREVAEHGVGMHLRIANDVGHAGLAPAVVRRFMAGFAGSRADELSGWLRGRLLRVQAACGEECGAGQKEDAEHDGPVWDEHNAMSRGRLSSELQMMGSNGMMKLCEVR